MAYNDTFFKKENQSELNAKLTIFFLMIQYWIEENDAALHKCYTIVCCDINSCNYHSLY